MRNIEGKLESFEIVPDHYVVRVLDAYQRCRCSHVEGIEKWLRKLEKINKEREPNELEAQIRSHCFELEVVDSLSQYESVNRIVYEPTPIERHGKNCDLRIYSEIGNYFVEIKSFSPECSSRPLDSAYFPKHATVDLVTVH